jgi:hypothetical protein
MANFSYNQSQPLTYFMTRSIETESDIVACDRARRFAGGSVTRSGKRSPCTR